MESFIAEAFTYLCLAITIIFCRLFIRIRQFGLNKLFYDDYFMLLTIVPYVTETVLAHFVTASYGGLTNSGMTPEERKNLSPDSEEYAWRVGGSKVQVAGWCMYVSVLWCVKASLCCFYSRLSDGVSGYRFRVRIGYLVIAGSYIIVICSLLFSCHPMRKFWQIYPDPGNICQPALSKVYVLLSMILNIVTDIYLLCIPLPMLWGTKLPMVKRLSLVVLFSGAVFVMAAGLLRGVLILKNPIEGPRQGSSWAVRESFVAVVTSNLPMIWGWAKTKLKPYLGSILSSGRQKYEGREPGSIRLADTNEASAWQSAQRKVANTLGGASSSKAGGFETMHTNTVCQGPDSDCESSDASVKEIMASAQNMGGITKQVAVSVSSTTAQPDRFP